MKIIKNIILGILLVGTLAIAGTYFLVQKSVTGFFENASGFGPQTELVDGPQDSNTLQVSELEEQNAKEIAELKDILNSNNESVDKKIKALNRAVYIQKSASGKTKQELTELIADVSTQLSVKITDLGVQLEDLRYEHLQSLEDSKKTIEDMRLKQARKDSIAAAKIVQQRMEDCKKLEIRNRDRILKLQKKLDRNPYSKKAHKWTKELQSLKCN